MMRGFEKGTGSDRGPFPLFSKLHPLCFPGPMQFRRAYFLSEFVSRRDGDLQVDRENIDRQNLCGLFGQTSTLWIETSNSLRKKEDSTRPYWFVAVSVHCRRLREGVAKNRRSNPASHTPSPVKKRSIFIFSSRLSQCRRDGAVRHFFFDVGTFTPRIQSERADDLDRPSSDDGGPRYVYRRFRQPYSRPYFIRSRRPLLLRAQQIEDCRKTLSSNV